MDIVKKVKIDFCHHTVILIRADDVIEYRNNVLLMKYPLLRGNHINNPYALCIGSDAYPDKTWVIVPNDLDTIGVIVHEVVHAVDNIIDIYGFEGSEIRAYLTEYILEELVATGPKNK